MRLLSREQILNAKDVEHEDVQCPEWGGVVRIAALTASARAQFVARSIEIRQQAEAAKKPAKKADKDASPKVEQDIEMLLVALSAIDEQGNLLFSMDDVRGLGRKAADPISRCAAVALKLSRMGESAVAEEKKDSAPTQSGDSSSA